MCNHYFELIDTDDFSTVCSSLLEVVIDPEEQRVVRMFSTPVPIRDNLIDELVFDEFDELDYHDEETVYPYIDHYATLNYSEF